MKEAIYFMETLEKTNKNVMSETHPDLAKYLVNKKDAEKYSYGSNEELFWKCGVCGREFKKAPHRFKNGIFTCKCFSIGYSFPNRIFYAILLLCSVDFYPEKYFEWERNYGVKYCYDFYVPSKDIIIEMMGSQHFRDDTKFNKYVKYSIKDRDIEKENMAKENGIKNYYKIDCSKSVFKFIKKSIIESNILKFLEIRELDWDLVLKNASSNFVYDVCKKFEEDNTLLLTDMRDIFKFGVDTIARYLSYGNKLGICNYNKEEMIRRRLAFMDKKKTYWEDDLLPKILRLFDSKYSIKDIATSVGVCTSVVRRLLKKSGYDSFSKRFGGFLHDACKKEVLDFFSENPTATIEDATIAINRTQGAILDCIKEQESKGNVVRDYDSVKKNAVIKRSKNITKEISKYTLDGEYLCTYKSSEDAAFDIGVLKTSVARVARGERPHCGGYVWKYENKKE